MSSSLISDGSGEKRFFNRFLTVVVILIIYIISASFLFNYFHDMISSPVCECTVPLTWILVLLSTSGVVIGVGIYYYLSESFQRDKRELEDVSKDTLKLLPGSERKILESIIDSEGKRYQSDIVEDTGFNKAKVSRKISKLEDKDIIQKKDSGMSNVIKLKQPFGKLYVDEEV